MIKNKTLDKKNIFKTYLKIIQTSLKKKVKLPYTFLFYKTSNNSFQKSFLKIISENIYQTSLDV